MCLAVPLRLIEIHDKEAVAEANGIRRTVRVDFIPNPQVGDYVLVHAGFAMERLKEEQALANLKALQEVADAL
ncbi:HypC/HybG/HupF family hydrogenase formation chaperone [Pseudoflavonifractor capillosus]|uniref:HypC/HybG/HupF family hydrogenase formation chaperone n=1 Tax=Pseudoflavonifractor capillosus TaxID=106588 RepID=UPI00195B868B|nr:HypC/HybG/HupF family hydrogenase formation chaperone [Pseudoflavonifractor capillosus]MBM6896104.1 HypC/HybG/HupF family hydrogenase formation chaperone [Pseudoflavonifractor capillosus]